MTTATNTLPAAATANTKPLWAAVGVLGFAVVAMGASLVYVQTRPAASPAALVAMAPAIELQTAPAAQAAALPSATPQDEVPAVTTKPHVVAAKPAVAARPKPARSVAPVAPVAPAPVVVAAAGSPHGVIDHGLVVSQPAARPICATCGTVEAVTPMQRKGEAKGVGAVAGGVLGAVVGNQIGHGGGRTAATLLGALGGGFAGNAIEKNVRKETVYQARVRMEDGSTRTIEQATLPSVGSKVVIEGSTMHPADGGAWPAPAAASPQAQPPQAQNGQVFNRS